MLKAIFKDRAFLIVIGALLLINMLCAVVFLALRGSMDSIGLYGYAYHFVLDSVLYLPVLIAWMACNNSRAFSEIVMTRFTSQRRAFNHRLIVLAAECAVLALGRVLLYFLSSLILHDAFGSDVLYAVWTALSQVVGYYLLGIIVLTLDIFINEIRISGLIVVCVSVCEMTAMDLTGAPFQLNLITQIALSGLEPIQAVLFSARILLEIVLAAVFANAAVAFKHRNPQGRKIPLKRRLL